jgi:coenzyme F420-0:L-glutamate ligase/coenzyme F420-1:gamma-L-glutamate ligase
MGEIVPGDDLSASILAALEQSDMVLEQGDIVCVAQKIVSKAESRYAVIDEVIPSAEAEDLALRCDKDPRLVELILSESEEVLRVRPGVVVVQHRLGYVHANAGIDRSNLIASDQEQVLLLPLDSDLSAERLRQSLQAKYQVQLGVLINDSAGRAWRVGTTGMAIGVAGFAAVEDLIGQPDRIGRIMEVSQVGVADELAAASSFVMGQGAEGLPVVIIRGANVAMGDGFNSKPLIRDKQMDLFR